MHRVLLLGAGKIGRTIGHLLAGCGDYSVTVADVHPDALGRVKRVPHLDATVVDASSEAGLRETVGRADSVVSALSFQFNETVARVTLDCGASYFDLTEDVATTKAIRLTADRAADGQIFMPQCGLAPGFVSIAASHLTRGFDSLDSVRLRVGALPQFPTNAMSYNLTWSTDGLINEYCNLCEAIHEGRRLDVLPLEGLERFALDGIDYEAFNTSGGLGTLCESLDGRVRELNYKTVRYPGHHALMAFLIHELRLSERRGVLRDVLESAVPVTFQDVVIVSCTVAGRWKGQLVQKTDARKIYPREIDGERWSAIQITTATGLCAVLDLHREGRLPGRGFVRQEQVDLDAFLANRFGRYCTGARPTAADAAGEHPAG